MHLLSVLHIHLLMLTLSKRTCNLHRHHEVTPVGLGFTRLHMHGEHILKL